MPKRFYFEYLDGAKGWREQDYEFDASGLEMPDEFIARWNEAQAVIKSLELELDLSQMRKATN